MVQYSAGDDMAPFDSVRTQQRDGKADEPMTSMEQSLAARRRGEFNRDRGLRRLSQAADAQRRLIARRPDSARAKAEPVGPSDPPATGTGRNRPISAGVPTPQFDEQRSGLPGGEVRTEVSGRDPEAMLTDDASSEVHANQHDADRLGERVGPVVVVAEHPLKQSYARDGASPAVPPARSVRRATARRASNRRATARNRQGDSEASLMHHLAQHPESTAGDLAKGLNLDPGSVATRLSQLAKAGKIKRASHGYSTIEAARPDTP